MFTKRTTIFKHMYGHGHTILSFSPVGEVVETDLERMRLRIYVTSCFNCVAVLIGEFSTERFSPEIFSHILVFKKII